MSSLLFSVGLAFGADNGVAREFTVTGYYSPLPNQSYYVTGSYETDIRLNGQGTHGADGTAVFPGMIAAPSDYAFGTVVCLPDFGCGSVHDRGGAIVNKGERSIARHDRLDLWMGYGEEGLARALDLGLWHTSGVIYTDSDAVELGVNFKVVSPIAQVLDVPEVDSFDYNLSIGSEGELVKELQKNLVNLGYLNASEFGVYGNETAEAVLAFQLKNKIVTSESDLGARVFGPKTRATLSQVLYDEELNQLLRERWNETHFEGNLSKGEKSDEVWALQEVLLQLEYLDHQPTGYFGMLTKEALIDFQIEAGLVVDQNSIGAGSVGPQTREKLNLIIADRNTELEAEETKVLAYLQNQESLNFFAGGISESHLASR